MEISEIKENLKGIGLTENETKVYMSCLQLGSCLASEIAEKCEIYRTLTYDILNNLIEKGLVSYYMRENRKYFHAVSPDSLIKYLEEKERILKEQKEAIKPIIEDLKKLEMPKKEPYSIEVYKGKEGFKSLLEDILKEKKNYNMIGYESLGSNLLGDYFIHWQKRRIKEKIKRYIIAEREKEGEIKKHDQLTEVRFFPKDYKIPTSILVYADKAILFLSLKDDFVAVKVESKEIAESFNNYFKLMWGIAKP